MHTRSGSALVITLGLLAVLGLLVIGYVYSARTERFAARHARDRVTARQYVDLALNAANETITSSTAGHGYAAIYDLFIDDSRVHSVKAIEDSSISILDFFQEGTNQIPFNLHDMLRGLSPDWIPIRGRSENAPYDITGTNGYFTYAIFNCSGLLDANFATSNQLDWLARQETPDITDLDLFLHDRARATATNGLVTQYLDLHDLRLRSRGLAEQPRNLFTWSYDPGPDVTVTNGDVYSHRDVQLVPKFNVNSWTNQLADLTDLVDFADKPDKLAEHYQGDKFGEWLSEVTNRLATIGFANPQALAWNLVNFMDPDRIPQGPEGHIAWQEPWPVEDVPLINEVAVGMVPMDMIEDQPNHYAPGVELWFPFAINSITSNDHAQLVVAVYTNWPPSNWSDADRGVIENDHWTNNVIEPRPKHGIVFTNDIEHMQFGTDTEFLTFTLPPPYLSFPVEVTNAVQISTEKEEEKNKYFKPKSDSSPGELVRYSDPNGTDLVPPPLYDLVGTNLFLPLGVASYYTYLTEQRAEQTVWVRSQITVTNTIHLLARVKLGKHWVDEAAGYHPPDDDGHGARTNLLVFTEPCGYEVNDPRRNGYREDWHRYLPADRAAPAWDASAGPRPVCSLDGSTNVICNPWHNPFGQGLPLTHFNRLLDRAGDIGYIQQPERYENPPDSSRTLTNLWQSICLADPTLLAQYAFPDGTEFSYSSGSVLEFFTARATNTPVRGLVHFSTTHTNVVRALLADLTVGIPGGQTNLLGSDIDWMQEVFFAAQQKLYTPRNTPIGVGDLCYGIGSVPLYCDATDPSDQSDLSQSRPWQNSLGNDLKEDILRGLAERISFRQHVFVICLAGKTVAPSGRTTAMQRAVAIVLRDAYTGRWKVVAWEWL